MKASVFVGTSLDGFIARQDDTLDFLDAGHGVPHGYDAFYASVDTLLWGRNTYDVVLGFGSWPFGTKRVVVLSHRPLKRPPHPQASVERMSGSPARIAERLRKSGARHVYVDGGITIQRFLRAGLVDRLIVTRLPVLIGRGIPLFGALPRDVKLRHVATRTFPKGLVQSEYKVLR